MLPSPTAIIQEDWMYFKQNEDDKWLLKYCRCQSPFLFIYKNEELKRQGKPDIVLIINDNLSIKKSNDRIAYCTYVKIKERFSYTKQHWSVITKDGYIIVGKLYHVDADGNRVEDDGTSTNKSSKSKKDKKSGSRFGRKGGKNKGTKISKKSRTFSVGMDDIESNWENDITRNKNRSQSSYNVLATKEHDEIETAYKWDIANIRVLHSGSPELSVPHILISRTCTKYENITTSEKHQILPNGRKLCQKYDHFCHQIPPNYTSKLFLANGVHEHIISIPK